MIPRLSLLALASWLALPAAADPVASPSQMAATAVQDLVAHFWTGTPDGGCIAPTWHGYVHAPLPDARGAIWERATFYFVLTDYEQATHDPVTQQRLAAEWKRTKAAYRPEKLQAVGEDSGINWASDDAGWAALFYFDAYRATGDPDALADAKGVVLHSFARWMDGQLGGGMWYADVRHSVNGKPEERTKSLYQTAIVLAALRIYETTHERAFLAPALQCDAWIESHLRRPDGIYWAGYTANGPQGRNRPNDIHEAGSVSFLGGNMGMGVIDATLFRLTGDDHYRQRAVALAAALRASREVDASGVLVDDRDAWTDGTFAGDWAAEVLTLPGIAPEDRALLSRSAAAIFTRDRTPDGYYGGCWDGPADGPGSVWSRGGSKPQQITTSASAANVIVAAAVAAKGASPRAP